MAKIRKKLYGLSASWLLRLWKWSLRYEIHNHPECEPVVYGLWHRNLIHLALLRAGDPVAVMVSASKDGELIALPLERFGYKIVRGSTSRRGSAAFRGLLRHARTRSLAITPDGPRGPIGTIHPGIFQLALMAKIPIVAVWCDTKWEWVFNSWDRFRFPKPFAKIQVRYSDPIWVKSKEDIHQAEKEFRAFLEA